MRHEPDEYDIIGGKIAAELRSKRALVAQDILQRAIGAMNSDRPNELAEYARWQSIPLALSKRLSPEVLGLLDQAKYILAGEIDAANDATLLDIRMFNVDRVQMARDAVCELRVRWYQAKHPGLKKARG